MMIQDQLLEAASSFDVGHEPTAPALGQTRPAIEGASPGSGFGGGLSAEPQNAAASSGGRASDFEATSDPEGELERLEKLLAAQAKERLELARELERRSALLRDACARFSGLAPTAGALELSAERDAAVARAVEAEVARAEATFKLDEALGQLYAQSQGLGDARPPSQSLGDAPVGSEMASSLKTLKARVAELEELSQTSEARRLLVEHELAHERTRVASATRERVEGAERLELEVMQAQARSDAMQRKLLEIEDARCALAGESDGLRARLNEFERAFRSSQERLVRAQRMGAELQTKLEASRVEQAAHATRADVHAVRMDDLLSTRALDQDAVRHLRAELEREQSARTELATQLARAQSTQAELADQLARERSEKAELLAQVANERSELVELVTQRANDRHEQTELVAQLASEQHAQVELAAQLSNEQDVRAELAAQLSAAQASLAEFEHAAGDQNSRSPARHEQETQVQALRAGLLELKSPLLELEAALAQIGQAQPGKQPNVTSSETLSESPTLPGVLFDAEALGILDEKIRFKDARIEELEAALRASSRDVNISTLKGELIDVRASAGRLADDLAKERARRRKVAVTVRALQAATDSGEAPGPWIEELIALINEGTSLPPRI